MTSGGFASPNSLIGFFRNTNASNLISLTVSYDAERYRINTAAASVQFYYSLDGTSWTSVTAGDIGTASFPTGSSAYTFSSPLVVNRTGISITGLNIATNGDIYLRWNINTTGANSQGIAIDNISITAAFTTPSASITTSSITGSPFCVSASAGAVVNVPFTITGTFNSGNVFTAQLSDASGSFASPVNIGSLTSATAGTISATIPAGTASGTGYRIRVVGSDPVVTGSANAANLVINTAVSIVTQPSNQTVSAPTGSSFAVSATGTGLSYQWQIEDGNGWNNLSNGGIYSGATTATLTLSSTTEVLSGNLYRVVVSGASPCTPNTSGAALLQVNPGPCLAEGFESPTAPATGWVYNGSVTHGTNSPRNGERTATFTANNQEIITPLLDNPTSVSFWYRRSSTSPTAPAFSVWYGSSPSGPWTQIGNTITSFTTAYVEFNEGLPVVGSVHIRVLHTRVSGGNQIYLDDFSVNCGGPCVPAATLTQFLPASGPAGTLVTLSGSGFTPTTGVSFDGLASTAVTFVNASTLVAEVPGNAITGPVAVVIDGCALQSTTDFTVLNTSGTCGVAATGTEPMITEVYDAFSGSLSYIELFNPTAGAINLGTGQYRIRINTIGGNPGCGAVNVTDINLSGSIASGATFVLSVGTSAASCPVTVNQAEPTSTGFNGNDYIELRKGAALTIIDRVDNPNYNSPCGTYPGFSQRRLSTVTAPSATYNPAEWVNLSPESCADLGIPPYAIGSGSNVTITAQPNDFTACTTPISFIASSLGTGSGTNSTLWKVYNPFTNAWENASGLSSMPPLYNTITPTNTNTPNMGINGNTAQLNGFQFYAQVTRGSCTRVSRAVQYQYESLPVYRSTGTGNWDNSAVWEMSDDGVNFVAACRYPVAENSTQVFVSDGHKVTMNVSADLDFLHVEPGAEVELSGTTRLRLLNSQSGADLVVLGTFTDKATTPNGTSFATGATWELGANATIVKTNTSSVNNYRDNYENGIANVPATAHWIYRREAANDLSVSTVGMHYPNLTFENQVAGTYNPTGTQFFFDGSTGGTAIVKGSLNIGGNGPGNYVLRTNNFNTNPILVQGNLTIRSGSTLTNDHAAGSNDGTGIEVRGNLEVNGALDLTATGTSPQRGQLLLTGGVNQIITGGGSITANRLLIDKASNHILSSSTISIAQHADFASGVLQFDESLGTPYLQFTNSATHSGASASSFVHGRVQKIGFVAYSEFAFPTGHLDLQSTPEFKLYQPAYLTANVSNTTAAFDVQYFHQNYTPGYENPNNRPPRDPSLTSGTVSTCNYWMIDRVPATPAINARVKLSWNAGECVSIDDPDLLVVARWDEVNNEWSNTSLLQPPPINSGTGLNGTVATGHFQSQFSPFTIATSGLGANILPITLLTFAAAPLSANAVLTRWTTLSEINNDFFTVERSSDGNAWEEAGRISGAGNSNEALHYRFIDQQPYSGTSYYRLRQTDFDGTTTLSEPMAVTLQDHEGLTLYSLWRGDHGIQLTYRTNRPLIAVQIFDVSGRLVHTGAFHNDGGVATIETPLGRGIYLLRISDGNQEVSRRFFY